MRKINHIMTLGKNTKRDRWMQEFAENAAVIIAANLEQALPLSPDATDEERKAEWQMDFERAKNIMLADLQHYPKYEIQYRIKRELSKRCGQKLASDLVKMIDIYEQDEKSLMELLIGMLQQPNLFRDLETARSEWNRIIDPYRSAKDREIATRNAEIEKQALLAEEARHRTEKIAKENKMLQERIRQLEVAQAHDLEKGDLTSDRTGLKRQGEDHLDSPIPKMRR